jgi:CRP-like cAMP-binding protein
MTLADVHATFKEHLYLPDAGVIDVTFGTYAANCLPGDPTWMNVIGPSSAGKTEPAMAMRRLPHVRIVSSMTEAALLSGTAKKERSKEAKGGLLKEIGSFGILICKDFTSILSMRHEQRTVLLGHLRDIYDGHMDRKVGTDGGQTLTWEGKIGFLAVCTDAIDTHHAVMAAMGHRFLFYRLPLNSREDRHAQAKKALQSRGRETNMRLELSETVEKFFAALQIPQEMPTLTDQEESFLVTLSDFATQCRSAVERDGYRREIELIHSMEAPARLAKALQHLHEGFRVVGVLPLRSKQLLAKIALDSIPKIRVLLIDQLARGTGTRRTKDLASAIGYPTETARRALEDLAAQHVVTRKEAKLNVHAWELNGDIRNDYHAIKGFSEISHEVHP